MSPAGSQPPVGVVADLPSSVLTPVVLIVSSTTLTTSMTADVGLDCACVGLPPIGDLTRGALATTRLPKSTARELISSLMPAGAMVVLGMPSVGSAAISGATYIACSESDVKGASSGMGSVAVMLVAVPTSGIRVAPNSLDGDKPSGDTTRSVWRSSGLLGKGGSAVLPSAMDSVGVIGTSSGSLLVSGEG